VSEKSQLIDRLKDSKESRAAYTRAKLSVNIPSQVRALRRRRELTQAQLAVAAEMKQSRISAIERPGAVKLNLETLIRLAAAFKVGLIVKFAPFGEMLDWENSFSQDVFNAPKIEDDLEFLGERTRRTTRRRTTKRAIKVIATGDTAMSQSIGAIKNSSQASTAQEKAKTSEQLSLGLGFPVETLQQSKGTKPVFDFSSWYRQSVPPASRQIGRQIPRTANANL
jgi:transcriptional regulator with XRE-family HTH domain